MENFRSLTAFLPTLAAFLCLSIALGSTCTGLHAAPQPTVRLLTKAEALPLALDPAFEFRKMKSYFLESPQVTGEKPNNSDGQESITFERRHLLYGAITGSDTRDRYGNYYTFFWRAKRAAGLTVRLEYRQAKLGGLVQAREVDYPNALGSHATRFAITGDDYLEQGRVSAWRVLLVENHRTVVALSQSYLWR